jgi:hypothetical protein
MITLLVITLIGSHCNILTRHMRSDGELYHINQMITLIVITLIGSHCIILTRHTRSDGERGSPRCSSSRNLRDLQPRIHRRTAEHVTSVQKKKVNIFTVSNLNSQSVKY